MLRLKSIIGEAYVALSLGSPDAPPLPDGGTLAARNAVRTVEADEIFETYDPRTRQALREWMQSQGPGPRAPRRDLNTALASLEPWMIDADRLLSIVQPGPGRESAAARRRVRWRRGWPTARRRSSCSRGAATAPSMPPAARAGARCRLPRAARVRARRPAHGRAADGAGRGAHGRRACAAASSLPSASRSRSCRRTAPTSTRLSPPRRRSAGRACAGCPPSTGSWTRRRPSSSTSTHSCGASTPRCGTSRRPRRAHHAGGEPRRGDADGHCHDRQPRACALPARDAGAPADGAGPAVRASTGASRANAYPDPSQLNLLAGYLSLETGHCGRPTPYISSDPTPLLTDLQREQIRLYAFGGDPANPPRPACKQQAGGVPRLVA